MAARLSRSPSDDAVPRARDPACERFAITRHVTKQVSFTSHMEPIQDARRPAISTGNTVRHALQGAAVARVSFDDLARVPAQRLARLLLERAAEDPTLLEPALRNRRSDRDNAPAYRRTRTGASSATAPR